MNIKQYLGDLNISITDLARSCGLPYSTVAELANERKTLSKCNAGTVYRIANTLGLSMEELLTMENHDSFPDRYCLDRRESNFLAKKCWDENVYCGMRMENRNVTFPQTKTILEGINVPGVTLDDITAILNMRDAWKYMLKTMEDDINLEYILKLNSFISRNESLEWGVLRKGGVGVSGTDYKPPIPDRNDVITGINDILRSFKTTTEKALDMFCFITYRQLFWDGNKRTALCTANKILLSTGKGMLTIKDSLIAEFNDLLCKMYNTGNKDDLKRFLYEKAILGID